MKILRNEIDWLSLAFNGGKWLESVSKTEIVEGKTRFLDPVLPEGEARGKETLMKGTVEKYDFVLDGEKIGRFYRNVSRVREGKDVGDEKMTKMTNFPTKLEFEGTDLSDAGRRGKILALARKLLASGEARITKIDYAVDVGDIDPSAFLDRLKTKNGRVSIFRDNLTSRIISFGIKSSRGIFRCYDKKQELQDSGKVEAAADYKALLEYPGEVTRIEFRWGSEFCRRRDSLAMFEKIEAVFLRSLNRFIKIDHRKRKSSDPLRLAFPKVGNEVPESRDTNSNLVSAHVRMKRAEARLRGALRTLCDIDVATGMKSSVFAGFSEREIELLLKMRKFSKEYLDI